MASAVVSVILVLSLLLPSSISAETNSSTARRGQDVKVKESIERFKSAREESQRKKEEALRNFQARKRDAENKRNQTRDDFRRKLSQISDERKQKIVENIDTRIAQINLKWVEHWNNVLTRLAQIVAKIDERSDGSVNTTSAKNAIATAQNAVTSQAAKTYEIKIEGEETVGENTRSTLKAFHKDLREVHAQVKTAREEVVKALRALKEKNEE